MKRRELLAALPAAALAGCLSSQSTEPEDSTATEPEETESREPTVVPTTQRTEPQAETELTFGEWYSHEYAGRALKINGLRFRTSYYWEGAEYSVPESLKIALAEITTKNISNSEIPAEPNRSVSIWSLKKTKSLSWMMNDSRLEKPVLVGNLPETNTPELTERIGSGEKTTFTYGALVSEDYSKSSALVGYQAYGGDWLAIWRPE